MSDPLLSNHLGLPYLAPAQAQKHVTHNEALRRLDAVVQLAVIDSTATDPPGAPEEGDRYIVPAGASGDWADHAGAVAAFADGAWDYAAPETGWVAYDAAAGGLLVHDDGDWLPLGGYLGAVDRFGVNTDADATSRLAVRSNAVLFTAIAAADGGTGDVRFFVDKEADGDTASLLFQTAASGRAEVGLVGDTDFVFKVSPDGSSWIEAIRIDKDTGLPAILYDNTASSLTATTVQDAIDEIVAGGGGGGSVTSVFGRTGAVTAAAGDYDAAEIDFTPAGGLSATDVQAALAELDSEKASSSSLAAVATSGAYADLTGRPTLGTLAAGDDAGDVTYDNGTSGLASATVQGAIDEVAARTYQPGDIRESFDAAAYGSDWVELDGATITDGAVDYPIVAARYPWMVSGDDIKLPDYRGRAGRAWAHGSSNDPDRASRSARAGDGQTGDYPGTVQGDDFASHGHGMARYTNTTTTGSSNRITGPGTDVSSGNAGGNETRMKNISVSKWMLVG